MIVHLSSPPPARVALVISGKRLRMVADVGFQPTSYVQVGVIQTLWDHTIKIRERGLTTTYSLIYSVLKTHAYILRVCMYRHVCGIDMYLQTRWVHGVPGDMWLHQLNAFSDAPSFPSWGGWRWNPWMNYLGPLFWQFPEAAPVPSMNHLSLALRKLFSARPHCTVIILKAALQASEEMIRPKPVHTEWHMDAT